VKPKAGFQSLSLWIILCLITMLIFSFCHKTEKAKSSSFEYNLSTCPLYGMDELDKTEKKLRWTQKILLKERKSKNSNSQEVSKLINLNSFSSPFIAYLQPLSKKYHKDFDLSEKEMTKYLSALLFNETGNSKRFVPNKCNQKYLVLGDCNNACHAWQIDRRWHKNVCKPMTFEESGNYAIKKVLLRGYKLAKKKGIKDPHKAALAYYNSGQFNDKYTTNNYAQRAYKAMKGIS
jgi:hypothetical protein